MKKNWIFIFVELFIIMKQVLYIDYIVFDNDNANNILIINE